MKRMVVAVIVLFVVLAPVSSASKGETADDIIRKCIEAMGGEKNLRKVADLVRRGSIKNGGVVGTFNLYSKTPNKFRVEVDFGALKFLEVCDGKNAWQAYRGKFSRLIGSEAEYVKREAYDFNGLLLGHKARGIKPELLGTRKVQGREAHIIVWKYPGGSDKKLFIDTQTYMLIGEERFRPAKSGKKTLELSLYSDYKPIDGRAIPFKMIVVNQFGKSEIIFREAQNNAKLPLSLFQSSGN